METVIVSTPRVHCETQQCYTKPINKPPKEYSYIPRVSCVTEPYPIVKPVREEPLPDCCNPVEMQVPLKKTCVFLSQTPVLLFLILLTLVYLMSVLYCWNACNCNNNNHCKKKKKEEDCDNQCVSSSQKWTAFAANTIIYVLLAVLISMWIYRLSQYNQTRGLATATAIAVPIFVWFFFSYINSLVMCTNCSWC